ncbi:MAG: DNA-directed RNA polymerase subunit L [Methanobacteriaceae archaeon]
MAESIDGIEIIKSTKTELEIVIDENHSVCNALRKILMEDESVNYAVYAIDHPTVGKPIMTIKTPNKGNPTKCLLDASEELKRQCNELKSLIESV